jgi:hypothetical protein
MQPGAIVPGTPLGGGVLPCTYPGGEELIFPDFLNLATGHTLEVGPEPGAFRIGRVDWEPGYPYLPDNGHFTAVPD